MYTTDEVAKRAGAEAIRFHRLKDEYGAFTNFARYPLWLDGLPWATAEHYFQAQKFSGALREQIRGARTPREAARLGAQRTLPIRSDWEQVKVDVMRRAVTAKFAQHPALRWLLHSTSDRKLLEDTPRDYFWACGTDESGKNVNGQVLTELRTAINEQSPLFVPRVSVPFPRGSRTCVELDTPVFVYTVMRPSRWSATRAAECVIEFATIEGFLIREGRYHHRDFTIVARSDVEISTTIPMQVRLVTSCRQS